MRKVYLACPYSHKDPGVRQLRFELANFHAAKLMELGYCVFSPISHSHPVSNHTFTDPMDFDFWMKQNLRFLSWADEIRVLRAPGWDISRGVAYEIKYMHNQGKPVKFITVGGGL